MAYGRVNRHCRFGKEIVERLPTTIMTKPMEERWGLPSIAGQASIRRKGRMSEITISVDIALVTILHPRGPCLHAAVMDDASGTMRPRWAH